MRNIVSKESLEVKYKDSICAELCLKLWFESDWYFCNITESGCFRKPLSRKKVSNNHFVKSVQKQPYADLLQNRCFAKISQQENTCVGVCVEELQLYVKETQDRCFPVNIAKLLRTAFFIEHLRWCFCKFENITLQTFSS